MTEKITDSRKGGRVHGPALLTTTRGRKPGTLRYTALSYAERRPLRDLMTSIFSAYRCHRARVPRKIPVAILDRA
ncbi:MAG TPA: hypothetical protein VGX25_07695 [Actinophytocola sp.]|uniref:hypothetical protein n=1 Tax=Actinophytocola sp. TaxID=1872138 RepID=UPI002DDCA021|nr:hypothetical protein [Actinophytocola sp.]HEV2779270.1 hypothetical protein [Actinophytocola sp.]